MYNGGRDKLDIESPKNNHAQLMCVLLKYNQTSPNIFKSDVHIKYFLGGGRASSMDAMGGREGSTTPIMESGYARSGAMNSGQFIKVHPNISLLLIHHFPGFIRKILLAFIRPVLSRV